MQDREFLSSISRLGRLSANTDSHSRSTTVSPSSDNGRTFNTLRQEIVETVRGGFRERQTSARRTMALASQGTSLFFPIADNVIEPASTVSGFDARNKQEFMKDILPHAQQAGAALGISEDLLMAHAALESGWGRHPVSRSTGENSFNVFGVKAGASWSGSVTDVATTEYLEGRGVMRHQPFRAYSGYDAAFKDYVRLMRTGTRYLPVIGVGADVDMFSKALVKGAYATDPLYAEKIKGVFSDIVAHRQDLEQVPSAASKWAR